MSSQSNSVNTTLNPRVRKILMELDERPSLKSSNSVMTDMYGSGRVEKYVAPGNSGSYPSESSRDYLSVSNPKKIVDVSTGGNLKNIAKKVARVAKPHLQAAAKAVQPMVEQALKKKVAKLAGGKVNRLKKAKRFTDFAVNTAEKGIKLAALAKSALGGAKPKKGSPEMALKMAAIRAMRKK